LFDVDGTLIHTGGAGIKAFERAFATVYQREKGTEQLSFAGRTDSAIARDVFRQHQIELTPERLREFFDSYVFWLDHLLDKLEGGTMPGVRKLLRDLQALPQPPLLGLLTGNIQLAAEIKLRYYHLWENFEFGAFGDEHEDRNQLAIVAQQRASRLLQNDLAGEQILIVGDTPLDVACAKTIGARMLAVASGGHSWKQLQICQPTWTVESLREVSARDICA